MFQWLELECDTKGTALLTCYYLLLPCSTSRSSSVLHTIYPDLGPMNPSKRHRDRSPPSSSKRRSFSPPLPPGWSRWEDKNGRPYFINEEDGSTTWEDPRAPASPPKADRHERGSRAPARAPSPRRAPSAPAPRGNHSVPPVPLHVAPGPVFVPPPAVLKPEGPISSSVQLHVSNLDMSIGERELLDFFGKFSRHILKFNRSKDQYCFVHFGDDLDAALAAISVLDGRRCNGRSLQVRLTNTSAQRYGVPITGVDIDAAPAMRAPFPTAPTMPVVVPDPRQFLQQPTQPGQHSTRGDNIQIHCSGITAETTEEDLREFFHSFKKHLIRFHIKGGHGYSFVHMDSIRAGVAAIRKLNQKDDRVGNRLKLQLSQETISRFGDLPALMATFATDKEKPKQPPPTDVPQVCPPVGFSYA